MRISDWSSDVCSSDLSGMTAHDFELVIGDRNWSSWSLRPWLAMKVAGIPFREAQIRLRQEDTAAQIRVHSPSGQVPVLKWRGEVIADSLAICETVAELCPEKHLWPADPLARAPARSISAEMQIGRESCWASVFQNVWISVAAVHLKK